MIQEYRLVYIVQEYEAGYIIQDYGAVYIRLVDKPRANFKSYGAQAFSVAAPRLWNKLPLQIRLSSSDAVFKANLKTYLLKVTFDL